MMTETETLEATLQLDTYTEQRLAVVAQRLRDAALKAALGRAAGLRGDNVVFTESWESAQLAVRDLLRHLHYGEPRVLKTRRPR